MQQPAVSRSWRKSSYSTANGGNCVEVGSDRDSVLIRDTKDRGLGPVLRVTTAQFRDFLASVR